MWRSFVVAHSVHFQRALQARVHPRFPFKFYRFFRLQEPLEKQSGIQVFFHSFHGKRVFTVPK
jgi:hypothetical protein